jgi:RNA polymerase sigma-70 factor (ECF subfamily)
MNDLIPTRATLLKRLKNWKDDASWQDFFDTYWKVIYDFGLKQGLTSSEAQDVVQDTLVCVAKHIPTFQYNPELGSFKSWLLQITRTRIVDQLRKRGPQNEQADENETAASERVVDPQNELHDDHWEAEWERNLYEAALKRVKRQVDPQKYQIFDCCVKKEWPAEKVAKFFKVPIQHVYTTKHRLGEQIKAEVMRLQKEIT